MYDPQYMIRFPRRWIFGFPPDFLLENARFIKEYIDKNKLEPVPVEKIMPQHYVYTRPVPVATEKKPSAIGGPDFPGGIRGPHLHFEGDIYLLNEKQWGAFSREIVEGFKAKLDKAGTIRFEQLMELNDAIDKIVK